MTRIRTSVVWLAAVFVVLMSAFGYAQVGENHGADVSAVAKPTATPPGSDHGDEVKAEAVQEEASDEAPESGERKKNHGFYVSTAAQCEDVDDPDTAESPDFAAPDDCDGTGHGKYVSSVAKSSLGKKQKDG